MKRKFGIIFTVAVTAAAIAAILAGCSQGFSSGGTPSTPNTGSTAAVAPQTAPVAPQTPTVAPQTPAAPPAPAGPTSKSTVMYRPKTVTPQISGSAVSLNAANIARDGIELFSIPSDTGSMSFMAYQLDGKNYVRAAVCVPCGSKSFSLQNGTLICGACQTVFSGTTGAGVRGVPACMSYAKKAASYTIEGDNLVIQSADLKTAYQNTINRR